MVGVRLGGLCTSIGVRHELERQAGVAGPTVVRVLAAWDGGVALVAGGCVQGAVFRPAPAR